LPFLEKSCRGCTSGVALNNRRRLLRSKAVKTLDKIRQIFCEAVEKQTQQEREAYLDEVCRDNPSLRAEIDALLKAHYGQDDLLSGPILGSPASPVDTPLSESAGTIIVRYKLLEKIGEGGMAVVYMAEQQEPIRRKVALKIIKLGMDTRQVIARFEVERQALAMMDHPNIAKVLDAGATETGRPYFVMELVTGVSITEYCDKNKLSTPERLDLFVQICNAVQHAHQKGIIHRDIKPSNVMVTHHDGKPVPKVIDFGIAKAINQRLTEKTLFTRYAHIIGTPAYMSPEQAELSDLDIDTRTDIYSLGVLLYELLTGTTPFSEEELRKAGYIEMQRIIREKEPLKPSTKLSTLGDTLTDVAEHRKASPDLLRKLVRGDLDWIVMKSLEKDRARRYETANGLALDIRRHLEHEPVIARGPSTTYRLQKFLRRHRSQAIAALVMVIVAAVVTVILSLWNRDRLQLAEAEGFRHRGILSQAREQYARADRAAALETVKSILRSRHVGPEAQLLYAGILVDGRRSDQALTMLGSLLNDRPEIAGAAHSLLARILWETESPKAEKLKEIDQHRRQAEALLPETAEAYFLRAMTAVTVKEQLASLDRALQLDPGHYESRRLRAFTYYASRKYDQLRDDALAMVVLRPKDPLGYSLRAVAWRELGRYQEAIADYDSAIALTPKDSNECIELSAQRCEVLLRMGDYQRVITDAQASPISPLLAPPIGRGPPRLQFHLFCALTALGDYEKATALFQQIIAPGHEARSQFQEWSMKYVFDTLEAGRAWHPSDREPPSTRSAPVDLRAQASRAPARDLGAAFLPMLEAEETYRHLSAKAKRVITDGFTAHWSPDGKKLAFSAGVHGYSGVAIFDPATKETELLIVPGKDPVWSPDGKYIAFVRDCQFLRVSEFIAAEREMQHRLLADEEVWIMKSDGTEPRYLARGGWPCWSENSKDVYYKSRADNTFYLISTEDREARPKPILTCTNNFPSISPDEKCVAYMEGSSLKVKDLASQKFVAEWSAPLAMWGGAGWSPTGGELCMGGVNNAEEKIGLWIYNLDRPQPAKVLSGQIVSASWSANATELVFALGPPFYEIWAANLDPNIRTIEALGPGQTLQEHYQEMLRLYARRIEADPLDAYAYSSRAQCYDYLHDREKATADMRRWSAILSGQKPSDLQLVAPANLRRVINGPFGYQVVLSIEERENDVRELSIAYGQKGRCNMKSFKIPTFLASLFGFCLFSGLDTPTAYADLTFGEPVNLKTVIPVLEPVYDTVQCFSSDGLEMYISSEGRPGGHGDWDLWVSRRGSIHQDWGPLQNLGPVVNSAKEDAFAFISADGLTLYFNSDRPGGYGEFDIYMTTRATKNALWGPAVNIGPTVNSSSSDGSSCISPDGMELHFSSWRAGGYGGADIYVATRATANDPWGAPLNLGPVVNSAYNESFLCLSPDGLLLFFCDPIEGTPRPSGYGGRDMWMTRRASLSDPWQAPANLGAVVNGPTADAGPRVSYDGRTLYFWSNRSGGWENYQAPIIWRSDFTFGEPVNLGTVNPALDHDITNVSCLSFDGLEMYISSLRAGGRGDSDLWVLKRASIDRDWGPPENLGPALNSPQEDSFFRISVDGLTGYFSSNRSGGYGQYDIYMTTRATKTDPWGPPVNMGPPINGPAADCQPWVSPDGLELYFTSYRPGGYGDGDIYVAKRAGRNDPWGPPVNLGPTVNSPYGEMQVSLSADGLLLFFTDYWNTKPRPGGYGYTDIWITRRASLSDTWQAPVNPGPKLNGSVGDWAPWISPDGRTLYFSTTGLTHDPNTSHCWQVPIIPVVDFNGDGVVDMKDFSQLGQHWGQDESSVVDVAPMAWGDGMVDIADIAALVEQWLSGF
jgi:serine/threonine protein kinase/Tol biopolymer transport system component/tetratricopeptide (TPR) repeat protein